MREVATSQLERKLWFNGPNYTADAVVIDPRAAKILLIQRGDTGNWALPGGFIDPSDSSSYQAAAREAREETGIELTECAPLVFRGIVDDPRNDETAWIETSAHLFITPYTIEVHGADDALQAVWHNLGDLPPLYASHRTIVERGLDHIDSRQLIDASVTPDTFIHVDGGHMEYEKYIFTKDDQTVFAKQHSPDRYSDLEKAERSLLYLEKEAFTMAHLRQHGFAAIPKRSVLHSGTLSMDALRPEDGWQWRADTSAINEYIEQALEVFSYLETMPVPSDSFDIEPSQESFINEGWRSLNIDQLAHRAGWFLPRLAEKNQKVARQLLSDIDELHWLGQQPQASNNFVFCHHDVRQSNLAWHPKHGIKLVDWSWAGIGRAGSDATSLLIDLHKSGHDISSYGRHIDKQHCLTLLGFWLGHSTWPFKTDDTVRFQQFVSALSAYELLIS